MSQEEQREILRLQEELKKHLAELDELIERCRRVRGECRALRNRLSNMEVENA